MLRQKFLHCCTTSRVCSTASRTCSTASRTCRDKGKAEESEILEIYLLLLPVHGDLLTALDQRLLPFWRNAAEKCWCVTVDSFQSLPIKNVFPKIFREVFTHCRCNQKMSESFHATKLENFWFLVKNCRN